MLVKCPVTQCVSGMPSLTFWECTHGNATAWQENEMGITEYENSSTQMLARATVMGLHVRLTSNTSGALPAFQLADHKQTSRDLTCPQHAHR